MYRFFYDYASGGDVLFILIDPEKKVDRVLTKGNVSALYAGETLVGINVFEVSKTVKITAKGMIAAPEKLLVDAVNALLCHAGLSPLPFLEDSGFKVAKIAALEEHPLEEKAHLVTLECGNKTLATVSWYSNLAVGLEVVVATDGAIGYDGSVFHRSLVRGIPVECALCSSTELRLEGPSSMAFVVTGYASGEDFFLGGK